VPQTEKGIGQDQGSIPLWNVTH